MGVFFIGGGGGGGGGSQCLTEELLENYKWMFLLISNKKLNPKHHCLIS